MLTLLCCTSFDSNSGQSILARSVSCEAGCGLYAAPARPPAASHLVCTLGIDPSCIQCLLLCCVVRSIIRWCVCLSACLRVLLVVAVDERAAREMGAESVSDAYAVMLSWCTWLEHVRHPQPGRLHVKCRCENVVACVPEADLHHCRHARVIELAYAYGTWQRTVTACTATVQKHVRMAGADSLPSHTFFPSMFCRFVLGVAL